MKSSFKFPRKSPKGVTDYGYLIKPFDGRCPNCGSWHYVETISTDECHDCGRKSDYWYGIGVKK